MDAHEDLNGSAAALSTRIDALEDRQNRAENEVRGFGALVVGELGELRAEIQAWMAAAATRENEARTAAHRMHVELRGLASDALARVRHLDGEREVTLSDLEAAQKSTQQTQVHLVELEGRIKAVEHTVSQVENVVVDTQKRDLLTAEKAAEALAAENRKLRDDALARVSLADVEVKKTEMTLVHGAQESKRTWVRNTIAALLVLVAGAIVGWVAKRLDITPIPAPPPGGSHVPHP